MERVVARRDILVIAARKVIIDKKGIIMLKLIKRSTFPIKAENDTNCHRGCLVILAFMMIKIRW